MLSAQTEQGHHPRVARRSAVSRPRAFGAVLAVAPDVDVRRAGARTPCAPNAAGLGYAPLLAASAGDRWSESSGDVMHGRGRPVTDGRGSCGRPEGTWPRTRRSPRRWTAARASPDAGAATARG